MKGKDIIKIIQENQLEEFELQFTTSTPHPVWGFSIKVDSIDELVDIGYSDKVVKFGTIENES